MISFIIIIISMKGVDRVFEGFCAGGVFRSGDEGQKDPITITITTMTIVTFVTIITIITIMFIIIIIIIIISLITIITIGGAEGSRPTKTIKHNNNI